MFLIHSKGLQGPSDEKEPVITFLATRLPAKVLPVGDVKLVLVDAHGGHHPLVSPGRLQRVVKVVVKQAPLGNPLGEVIDRGLLRTLLLQSKAKQVLMKHTHTHDPRV